MSNLSYMDKIALQLRENSANIGRSKQACEDAGIDSDYTIGHAIQLFIKTHNLDDPGDPDLRNEFHDTMHIVALAHEATPRGEALAGVIEQTLLREPYNGDLNQKIGNTTNHRPTGITQAFVGVRQFNSAGHEDFEKPVPVATLESATSLGTERLAYTNEMQNRTDVVTDEEIATAYFRAVEIDAFFRELMGDRAVYQLSLKELVDTPLAFFGLEKTGTANELQFRDIPTEKRQKIIDNLDEQNTVLHHIESARTVDDLHSLGLELPDQQNTHPEL